MKSHHLVPLPTLVFLGLATFATGVRADVTEEFKHSYPLVAGGSVSLENANGAARIVAEDGLQEVRVQATKRGRDAEDLRRVEVQVDARADAVSIRTRYPQDDLRPSHASVDYVLTVPRSARLDAVRLTNGSLDLEGSAGGVKAHCVNGQVRARGLSGNVELNGVNGALSLEQRALAAGESIKLSDTNGAIRLTLPADVSARVRASTVNGGIENDFGLRADEQDFVGCRLEGQVGGSGGARVDLRTVNGTISLRKAR